MAIPMIAILIWTSWTVDRVLTIDCTKKMWALKLVFVGKPEFKLNPFSCSSQHSQVSLARLSCIRGLCWPATTQYRGRFLKKLMASWSLWRWGHFLQLELAVEIKSRYGQKESGQEEKQNYRSDLDDDERGEGREDEFPWRRNVEFIFRGKTVMTS